MELDYRLEDRKGNVPLDLKPGNTIWSTITVWLLVSQRESYHKHTSILQYYCKIG